MSLTLGINQLSLTDSPSGDPVPPSGPIVLSGPLAAPLTAQEGVQVTRTQGSYSARGGGSVSVVRRFEVDGISVSTGASYTPDAADIGLFFRYVEIATETGGTSPGSVTLTVNIGSVIAAFTAPAQMAAPSLEVNGPTQITVTLASAPDDGGAPITEYDLRYRPTSGGGWTTQQNVTSPVPIAGLSASTEYEVQTRAQNAIGNGSWSVSATATTAVAAPTVSLTPTSDTIPAGTTGQVATINFGGGAADSVTLSGPNANLFTRSGTSLNLVSAAVEGSYSVTVDVSNATGSDSATFSLTVSAAASPPVISGTSFDDATDTATFTTSEGGTLHWAIHTNAAGAPTLNSNGTWTGTTIETGSVVVGGSGNFTPTYTATTGDRLTYGIIDGDNEVSNLITEVFTPNAPPGNITTGFHSRYLFNNTAGGTTFPAFAAQLPASATRRALIFWTDSVYSGALSTVNGATPTLVLTNVRPGTKTFEVYDVAIPTGNAIEIVSTDRNRTLLAMVEYDGAALGQIDNDYIASLSQGPWSTSVTAISAGAKIVSYFSSVMQGGDRKPFVITAPGHTQQDDSVVAPGSGSWYEREDFGGGADGAWITYTKDSVVAGNNAGTFSTDIDVGLFTAVMTVVLEPT